MGMKPSERIEYLENESLKMAEIRKTDMAYVTVGAMFRLKAIEDYLDELHEASKKGG